MFDGKAFGAEIVGVVKTYVAGALSPLVERLDALERKLSEMPVPKDSRDADPEAVAAIVAEIVKSELAEIRTSVDAIVVPEIPDVTAAVDEAIAGLPKPVDADEVRRWAEEMVAAIPVPQDGKDADPEEVAALVKEEVQRAVAAIPAPQDGKSVTVDDVLPLIDESVSRAVASIPVPKDGCGIKELLIDRDGALVATMDDGRVKILGKVVGSDGADADMVALERRVSEMVAAIPAPKDGIDGIGFDDMDMEVRDTGVYLVWTKGDIVKEARLPIPMDRGVFKEGSEYQPGDGVTWGGSFWIAQETTKEKPDGGKGWRLAVKRGRDGKDGTIKEPPKGGPIKVG